MFARYNHQWFVDAALRVLWTFVQAFAAVAVAVNSVSGLKAAAVAGLAAALSALKSIIGAPLPWPTIDNTPEG